ncbi:polysaccharide deacetylase family protein [Hyphomicrobium sp.]|uniref:polysaccharide deacetylase family protein n=1 Tax=Hyphomicrobium sp. TaxID=82 RepID=UPI0025C738ED|nr:polysaccharide deacetylase family protein [Hyphomicrobium sp.]MCC7254158.1 polysaccharide deacetylase family protein [Hyphomicrobium sp.]
MRRSTIALTRTALSALHYSGLGALLAPLARGKGVIFTLHNVRPEPPEPFAPNRILKVTPEFLETAIESVRGAGYDIVSLDEAARRMSVAAPAPFACFTFDDGYRDNRDYAYPVFKRHGLPFAIYVPTVYADGEGDLWWFVLEQAIRKADQLRVVLGGVERRFETRTTEQKDAAFDAIYWTLRAGPEIELRATVRKIADAAGYDPSRLCRDLIMDWDELRALAADPLVTIGAHTRRHFAVAQLSEDEARAEIAESVARIERELGRPCRHFSFPYGDAGSAGPRDFAIARSLGLATAVTTQKDVLRARNALTGLPRISLNGDYQEARYVRAMMTGVPSLALDTVKASLARVRGLRGARGPEKAVASGAAATRPGAASI